MMQRKPRKVYECCLFQNLDMGALLKFVLKENFLKITKILRYREVSSKSIAKNQIKGTISPPPPSAIDACESGKK